MNALLLFLAQMLASLGAPIGVSPLTPVVGSSTHAAPAPPSPGAPPLLVADKDEATQISNGF